MTIALFDCRVADQVAHGLTPLWRSGQLASGPAVPALEARLGTYLANRSVVAMSDMTQALAMALRLAGVGQGDEVGAGSGVAARVAGVDIRRDHLQLGRGREGFVDGRARGTLASGDEPVELRHEPVDLAAGVVGAYVVRLEGLHRC